MDLVHKFSIPVSSKEAWSVLTDLHTLASCMPGAKLTSVDETRATGRIKVKLGAITSQFDGALQFVEQNPEGGRFVISAEGKDVANRSTADARITVQISPASSGRTCDVEVVTRLRMVGRVAQFGQGLLQDVSDGILKAFLAGLEASVTATGEPSEGAPGGESREARANRDTEQDESDVLDLGALAGPMVLSRMRQPILIACLTALLGWIILGQRQQRKILEGLAGR